MPGSCLGNNAGCGEVVGEIVSNNIEVVMWLVLGLGGCQVVGVAVACCWARNMEGRQKDGRIN